MLFTTQSVASSFIGRSSGVKNLRPVKALLFPLAAFLAVAGCASYPNGPIVEGGPVRSDGLAAIGQPTRVGAVVVTPKNVVEDSRCPMNARCVWAGQVIITARIDGAGWRETTSLKLGESFQTRAGAIALTSVRPEKMAGARTSPTAYLFGFEQR